LALAFLVCILSGAGARAEVPAHQQQLALQEAAQTSGVIST
jgi:hypothetical protein